LGNWAPRKIELDLEVFQNHFFIQRGYLLGLGYLGLLQGTRLHIGLLMGPNIGLSLKIGIRVLIWGPFGLEITRGGAKGFSRVLFFPLKVLGV